MKLGAFIIGVGLAGLVVVHMAPPGWWTTPGLIASFVLDGAGLILVSRGLRPSPRTSSGRGKVIR